MESIIYPPPDPSILSPLPNCLAIHLQRDGNDFERRQNVSAQKLPCFRRINGWAEWRAREDCIDFGKTVTADITLESFLLNRFESQDGLTVMWMARDGGCHQNRGIKVHPHKPDASLIRSSRTESMRSSQSKPRGALPR